MRVSRDFPVFATAAGAISGGILGASVGRTFAGREEDYLPEIAGGALGALGGAYLGARLSPAFMIDPALEASYHVGTDSQILGREALMGGVYGGAVGAIGGPPGIVKGFAVGVPIGFGKGLMGLSAKKYVRDVSAYGGIDMDSFDKRFPSIFKHSAEKKEKSDKRSVAGKAGILGSTATMLRPFVSKSDKTASVAAGQAFTKFLLPAGAVAAGGYGAYRAARSIYNRFRYVPPTPWYQSREGITALGAGLGSAMGGTGGAYSLGGIGSAIGAVTGGVGGAVAAGAAYPAIARMSGLNYGPVNDWHVPRRRRPTWGPYQER